MKASPGRYEKASMDAIQELSRTQHACDVLAAHKHPEIKRRLGLQGDYRKHYEAASKYLCDTAFALSATMCWIERGPFGRLRKKRLQKWIHSVDQAAAAKLSGGQDGQPAAGGEVPADVKDKVVGHPAGAGVQGADKDPVPPGRKG